MSENLRTSNDCLLITSDSASLGPGKAKVDPETQTDKDNSRLLSVGADGGGYTSLVYQSR